MRHVVSLVFAMLLVNSCSIVENERGGSQGNGPNQVLGSCNDVVTQDAVNAYNAKQSHFRIKASGASVTCTASEEINGHRSEVERHGWSSIKVYPKLSFVSLTREHGKDSYLLVAKEMKLTEDELKSIYQDIGGNFQKDDDAAMDSYMADQYPSFVRFEKGALFYLSKQVSDTQNGEIKTTFRLVAERKQSVLLSTKVSEFTSGRMMMDWLWLPQSGQVFQLVSENKAPGILDWSNVAAVSVLSSLVRDGDFAGNDFEKLRAIHFALWWDADIQVVNKEVPELLAFANERWRAPLIADNTVNDLDRALRYIVRIDPKSPKAPILTANDRVKKYFLRQAESLKTAVDYASGALGNEDRFAQLIATAETLVNAYGNSWHVAVALNDRATYDAARAQFFAKVAVLIQKSGLLGRDIDPKICADTVEATVERGLTEANASVYFEIIEILRDDFRADSASALATADKWVLAGGMNAGNKFIYFDLLKWLKSDVYLDFSQAVDIVDGLQKPAPLSRSVVDSFKAYYLWLTGKIYLNRGEAFQKTKSVFITNPLPSEQIQNIRGLTEWYIDTMYLHRSEALNRAEALVVVKNLSPERATVMRNVADWYVNEMYINRGEAMTKAEELIVTFGLSGSQVDVLLSSVRWLISDIYLNRGEAMTKGRTYVLDKKMDGAMFDALKKEYSAAIERQLSRLEALAAAERSVFGG
jgi:hypothetical protein